MIPLVQIRDSAKCGARTNARPSFLFRLGNAMRTLGLVPRHENAVKVDLLLRDANVALAVLDLADLTHIAELRQQRRQQAAKAYRTIIERLPEVVLTDQQRVKMAGTLKSIRKRLPTVV